MIRQLHGSSLLLLAIVLSACATAPPSTATVTKPSGPTFEQKAAWILRLEDQRMLRDPAPPIAPPPPPVAVRGRAPVAVATPPSPAADLVRLLADEDARVRR